MESLLIGKGCYWASSEVWNLIGRQVISALVTFQWKTTEHLGQEPWNLISTEVWNVKDCLGVSTQITKNGEREEISHGM